MERVTKNKMREKPKTVAQKEPESTPNTSTKSTQTHRALPPEKELQPERAPSAGGGMERARKNQQETETR